MAKPLPNEQALYQRIANERIRIPSSVWEKMYAHMGESITAINLILSYYIDRLEPVPVVDAYRILTYTRRIKEDMIKILHPEKDGVGLPLHPLVRDLFTHYMGNDTHIINLCVSFYLDPLDERPVACEDAQKILPCTVSMHQFLDRLRAATSDEKGSAL